MDTDPAVAITLYRAEGLNERRDIEAIGGFRLDAAGYEGGKWCAARFDDAIGWDRAMPRFPRPRPFRVVAVRVGREALADVEFHDQWDGVGPA